MMTDGTRFAAKCRPGGLLQWSRKSGESLSGRGTTTAQPSAAPQAGHLTPDRPGPVHGCHRQQSCQCGPSQSDADPRPRTARRRDCRSQRARRRPPNRRRTIRRLTGRDRALALPGVTIVPRPGPGALERDVPLAGGVSIASEARTMLESLRRPGGRRLTRDEIEAWIDQLAASGEHAASTLFATSLVKSLRHCMLRPHSKR